MTSDDAHGARAPKVPRAPIDPAALVTLGALAVMLMISVWNMRGLNRVERTLGERVSRLEAQLANTAGQAVGIPKGPEPNRVYTINVAGAAARGARDAPITIAEFSDFQCPFCAKMPPILEQIEAAYKGKVLIVWKHLPLSIHPNAVGAGLAAEAARKQNRFWEYHDKLFANQARLDSESLKQYAKELQLDMARFQSDLQAPDALRRINADVAEARALDVNLTPSFFINGRSVVGVQPFETFSRIIDEELSKLNAPGVQPKPPRP